jgi:hypothetical protein
VRRRETGTPHPREMPPLTDGNRIWRHEGMRALGVHFKLVAGIAPRDSDSAESILRDCAPVVYVRDGVGSKNI